MKHFYVLVFLVSAIHADKLFINDQDLIERLEKGLERRCLRNCDRRVCSDLRSYKEQLVRTCFQDDSSLGNEENLTNMVCRRVRQCGYRCLTNILDRTRTCLNDGDKQFLTFFTELYNVSFDYVCNIIGSGSQSGLRMIDLGMQLMGCRRTLEGCIWRTRFMRNLDNDNYSLSRSDFCRDIAFVRDCVTSNRKEQEGSLYLRGLFDRYMTLCDRTY